MRGPAARLTHAGLAGATALVDAAVGDSATPTGIGLVVAGIAVAVAAELLARALAEPDDVDPAPSTFRR